VERRRVRLGRRALVAPWSPGERVARQVRPPGPQAQGAAWLAAGEPRGLAGEPRAQLELREGLGVAAA
jgi:hypothetical protein